MILVICSVMWLANAWLLFGHRLRLGQDKGDAYRDPLATPQIMYTAFSVVMAVQTIGLARRIAIAYGHWTDPDPMPADAWTLYVGMAVFLAGVGLRLWAVRVLGRLFTFAIGIRSEHRIVRDGPYRWIRHPSYTGYLLVALGIALSYASLAGVIAVVVGIGGFYTLRIPAEERMLEAHFGEDYRAYRKSSWRLLPFFY